MVKTQAYQNGATNEEKELAERLFLRQSNAVATIEKEKSFKRKDKRQKTMLKPAWIDADDEKINIDLTKHKRLRKLQVSDDEAPVKGVELQNRLKTKFYALNNDPTISDKKLTSWADPTNLIQAKKNVESDPSEMEYDALFTQSTAKLLLKNENERSGSGLLPPGHIEIFRQKDANQHSTSTSAITSVQFHPQEDLLLTAGFDKTLHLFQIDGTENAKIQDTFFKNYPIQDAKFTARGDQVLLCGPRPHLMAYDLESGQARKISASSLSSCTFAPSRESGFKQCVASNDGNLALVLGRDGYMTLLSAPSLHPIGSMKMNGQINAAAFCNDGNNLVSTGSDGQVYFWDLRSRKCIQVFQDEGSLGTHSIASATNNQYFATGSESGVVNIYSSMDKAERKPLKALMHLTTNVDNMQFNSDSQVLAIASRDKKDALKFVHIPSFTVFSNWPTSSTPLNYVTALAFSPRSGAVLICLCHSI